MPKRSLWLALVFVFTVILLLSWAGTALAAEWSDLSLSILGDYGITEQQVAGISDGFSDGTWKPYAKMPRKQFVKMAVDAFKIPLATPATPTYTDVPKTDFYYGYIEGATAAGLTNGIGGGKFAPNDTITREQAVAIIVRWVAEKNGYDLDQLYTAEEIDEILAAYPDASAVGPSLKAEMAFAVDFGIVWGTAFGKLDPKGTLTRIQGAAMLIRSLEMVPEAPVVPAKIELVSDDKAENLIGLTHQATFKVTQADGSAAPGVLVDFDTLVSDWYVGNVDPEAGVTDEDGLVTVNMLSTEPGMQRVSAAVPGLSAIYTTKYWVALDEVYILDPTRTSRNNVGTPHEWCARVVVFGPGPLSTSAQDWYNAEKPGANPASPKELDGVDFPIGWVLPQLKALYQEVLPLPVWPDLEAVEGWVNTTADAYASENGFGDPFVGLINTLLSIDRFTYGTEQMLAALGYVPRSMAGIPVEWNIVDVAEDEASVGAITAASENGTIAAGGQSATAFTDDTGKTCITIESEDIGATAVTVVADYLGNPYPGLLFNHLTWQGSGHFLDWDDQPLPQATALKTWISHTLPPGGDSPIDPAFTEANIGEEFFLTLTLVDVFGNPIEGRQVEWFMQGIGHFVTDDNNTITDPDDPAGNKDFDVTDADGQARVMVKSLEPGEQIVHAKVRDKGTGGNEGTFVTYDAEVQWFDVDVVTFDNPAILAGIDGSGNEAFATNVVGGEHTFTLNVMGLKLELDPSIDDPAGQTPYIDTDFTGAAYDGVIDAKDAAYFGGILLVGEPTDYDNAVWVISDGSTVGEWPFDANDNGRIDDDVYERGTAVLEVQGKQVVFTGVGGYTQYDWDMDAIQEPFAGQSGIYLPLEGKEVTFMNPDDDPDPSSTEDAMLDPWVEFDPMMDLVDNVGSFTPTTPVFTDENGQAQVTVASDLKGPQTIQAIVDWVGNPHDGPELLTAFAKKIWMAGDNACDVNIGVTINGEEVNSEPGDAVKDEVHVPAYILDEATETPALNSANIEVHVTDAAGNDLPDYEVVYLLENVGTTLPVGGQGAATTYLPAAYLVDLDTENLIDGIAYDQNGTRPDSNEPAPASDPFATIVGPGGTQAFFFNQWLGAAVPGSATADRRNGAVGHEGWIRGDITDLGLTRATAHIDGGPLYGTLLTDGAKAWTLDGYYLPIDGQGIAPNELTGSNIDVQLAEDLPAGPETATHFKTIVKIMVYAPADGIAAENTIPCAHFQFHIVWNVEPGELTSILLEQAEIIEGESTGNWITTPQTVAAGTTVDMRAQMLDQFDVPMADTTFENVKVFGNSNLQGTGDQIINLGTVATDGAGRIPFSASAFNGEPQSVVWTVWIDADNDNVIDSGEVKSNPVTTNFVATGILE